MAVMAALLLGGLGTTRVIAGGPSGESAYDDASVIAQSDRSIYDISLVGSIDDDGLDDDTPLCGAYIVLAQPRNHSLSGEDQVAFGLCGSTLKRALHPTGPPQLS